MHSCKGLNQESNKRLCHYLLHYTNYEYFIKHSTCLVFMHTQILNKYSNTKKNKKENSNIEIFITNMNIPNFYLNQCTTSAEPSPKVWFGKQEWFGHWQYLTVIIIITIIIIIKISKIILYLCACALQLTLKVSVQ